jgi:prepilin-type N-terminal cleavage/methylation domain-containing protein
MKHDSRSERSNRSGFTLIEILIVIAITALLAGLILTYSSSSRDQVSLYVEEAKLSQTIAKAKSLTISTYNLPEVPCGYGVHMDYVTSTYTLFSYNDPDPKSKCDFTLLDPSFETPITVVQLPANLAFKAPNAASVDDILFLPPNPDTWIWLEGAGAVTSTEGKVSLVSRSGTYSVNVSVSSAGQITF